MIDISTKMIGKTIGVWGDSILRGVVLDDILGSYRMISRNCVEMIKEILGLKILNRSRFGCTVGKGSRLLNKALDEGLDCDGVMLEYGGNDCDYDWQKVSDAPELPHQPYTPLIEFEQTMQQMIDQLRSRNIRPLLMSLPPIHSERYFRFLVEKGLNEDNLRYFLGDISHIYQHHEMYSLTITHLASQNQCFYAPVREAFLKSGRGASYICSDGIHPNEQGHELMLHVFTQLAAQMVKAI